MIVLVPPRAPQTAKRRMMRALTVSGIVPYSPALHLDLSRSDNLQKFPFSVRDKYDADLCETRFLDLPPAKSR